MAQRTVIKRSASSRIKRNYRFRSHRVTRQYLKVTKNAFNDAKAIAEGGGLKNRRLGAFSFRFLNRPSKKRGVCAQKCAQTVCRKRLEADDTKHSCGCI